jgi:hypothetical protein
MHPIIGRIQTWSMDAPANIIQDQNETKPAALSDEQNSESAFTLPGWLELNSPHPLHLCRLLCKMIFCRSMEILAWRMLLILGCLLTCCRVCQFQSGRARRANRRGRGRPTGIFKMPRWKLLHLARYAAGIGFGHQGL